MPTDATARRSKLHCLCRLASSRSTSPWVITCGQSSIQSRIGLCNMLHSLPGSTGRASAVALALLALDNWLILSGSTHTNWLCSEVICWLSLAVGFVVAAQSSLVTFRPQTRAALRLGFPTVIALCTAVGAICVSLNSRVLRSSVSYNIQSLVRVADLVLAIRSRFGHFGPNLRNKRCIRIGKGGV